MHLPQHANRALSLSGHLACIGRWDSGEARTGLLRKRGVLIHAVHSVQADKALGIGKVVQAGLDNGLDAAQDGAGRRAQEAALLGVVPLLVQGQIWAVLRQLLCAGTAFPLRAWQEEQLSGVCVATYMRKVQSIISRAAIVRILMAAEIDRSLAAIAYQHNTALSGKLPARNRSGSMHGCEQTVADSWCSHHVCITLRLYQTWHNAFL